MAGSAPHCESYVPYDFTGPAGNGMANTWDTNTVAKGTHTITQSITLSSGGTEFNSATFTVNSSSLAPAITAQPTSQTVTAGQAASFSVAATGTAPLIYQWQKNSAATSGATSSSYTTPPTTRPTNGAPFTLLVSNTPASVTLSTS